MYDDLSDHLPTFLTFPIAPAKTKTYFSSPLIAKRSFNKCNYKHFSLLLKQEVWAQDLSVTPISDSNILYNNFINKFNKIFNLAFPVTNLKDKKATKNNHNPWITPSLIKCCQRKSKLLRAYKKHKNTVSKIQCQNTVLNIKTMQKH